MRVALAYNAFYGAFKQAYPELKVFNLNKDNVTDYDLIIFSGGEDINPKIYGASSTDSYGFNDIRDKIELTILDRALTRKTNILGVCRGHQLINAYMGTPLVQDIYTRFKKSHGGSHPLNYHSGTSLVKYILENNNVNSMHHQGFESGYCKLTVTSTYNEIVESCEHNGIITVQFHPEFFEPGLSLRFFDYINRWVENKKEVEAEVIKSMMADSTKKTREIAEKMEELKVSFRKLESPWIDISPSASTTTSFNNTVNFESFNTDRNFFRAEEPDEGNN